MLRSVRAIVAALVLGGALLAIPAAVPPAAAGVGPLPTCRLADILTIPRDYDSWRTTLVDWILSVGPDYAPPDLVSISGAGVTGGGQVRAVAFDDLKAMAAAARRSGNPLGNVSAYRSYRQQTRLFNDYASGYGYEKAITFSARPGHSEHQLGLTIDFAPAGASDFVSESFGAGKWLSQNAWKFGWLMSYPKGKKSVTCYRYEPWHYRYVGRELAKEIHNAGVTIREYLWSHFTVVDPMTGAPVPTSSPVPSPAASGSPVPGTPTAPPASASPPTLAPGSGIPGSPPRATPDTGPSDASAITDLGTPLLVLGVVVLVIVVLAIARSRGRSSA